MKTLSVTEFKAEALRVIREVAKRREPIVLTNRGRPVVEIVPYRGSDEDAEPGKLSDALVSEKDIVSPVAESDWETAR